MIVRIDYIQLAVPKGCEAMACESYGTLLGLREIEKTVTLRVRGGCWFQCGDQQLHIGVESDFRPAKKAHPAFAVTDLAKLRKSLLAHAVKITDDDSLPGARRFTGRLGTVRQTNPRELAFDLGRGSATPT